MIHLSWKAATFVDGQGGKNSSQPVQLYVGENVSDHISVILQKDTVLRYAGENKNLYFIDYLIPSNQTGEAIVYLPPPSNSTIQHRFVFDYALEKLKEITPQNQSVILTLKYLRHKKPKKQRKQKCSHYAYNE